MYLSAAIFSDFNMTKASFNNENQKMMEKLQGQFG